MWREFLFAEYLFAKLNIALDAGVVNIKLKHCGRHLHMPYRHTLKRDAVLGRKNQVKFDTTL